MYNSIYIKLLYEICINFFVTDSYYILKILYLYKILLIIKRAVNEPV
jgi:hypothetical protein